MHMADLGDIRLHYRLDGPEDGAPLVLIHALGTDLRLWDALIPLLPQGLLLLPYQEYLPEYLERQSYKGSA